jgi:hypothetical protein
MANWFTETRIAWVKETVEIFGSISRIHIQRKFGVSTPQASHDIKEALKRWPKLMHYDTSGKLYRSGSQTKN